MTHEIPPENLVGRLAAALHRDRRKELDAQIDAGEFPFGVDARLRMYANERLLAVYHLVDALGDPDDEQELYGLICNLWLELRMEWTRYNQVMQYQLIRGGECDLELVARGGVCSAILGWLEGCLGPKDQEFLVDLAADPMAAGAQDSRRFQRLLSHQQRSVDALEQALTTAERPLHAMPAVDPDAYRRDIESLRQSAADAKHIPIDLVWPQLEGTVLDRADTGAWFVRLRHDRDTTRIDPRWVGPLGDALVAHLPWIVAHDMEATLEARREAGRASHLTVTVAVAETEEGLAVTLTTDGTGALADAAAPDGVSAQREAAGSRIALHLAPEVRALAS